MVDPKQPLGYRKIKPRESFVVDPKTGTLTSHKPCSIVFRDGPKIRPVAPFLEVFAITSEVPDKLVPLTTDLLEQEGLTIKNVRWNVEVANIKIFRRTGKSADKIEAAVNDIADHLPHCLSGKCQNFIDGKVLPLGSVRFIEPSEKFPEIRLRFTPAAGKVYGSSRTRATLVDKQVVEVQDPVIVSDDLVLYDTGKGGWLGYYDQGAPTDTNPGSIYAGYSDANNNQISWGYLDDECDGIVTVTLNRKNGTPLCACLDWCRTAGLRARHASAARDLRRVGTDPARTRR